MFYRIELSPMELDIIHFALSRLIDDGIRANRINVCDKIDLEPIYSIKERIELKLKKADLSDALNKNQKKSKSRGYNAKAE